MAAKGKKDTCPNSENGQHTMLLNAAETGYVCYHGCGKKLGIGPVYDVGAAHLAADIRGYGLRSVRR